MSNAVITITDKVVRMIRSMVYLAMKSEHRRGATTSDISGFLNHWAPSELGAFHEGVVERALRELHTDGLVRQVGSRWFLAGGAR